MYQVEPGQRAVGANVTVISEALNTDPSSSLEIFLYASNSTDTLTIDKRVAYFSYASWGADPSYSSISLIPNLNIRVSDLENLTRRDYSWIFSDLPEDYNDLVLTTITDVGSKKLSLNVSQCPNTIGVAASTICSSDTCGYSCECQFACPVGYEYASSVTSTTKYRCTANAVWNTQETICVQEVTTSATMLVTSTAKESSESSTTSQANSSTSTSPSITLPEKLDGCLKAAFTITIVGCILTVIFAITVACAMKKMWRFKKEPASKMFYLGFVAAAAACVLAIGLLFGSAACVAATIIGAIGSCSMLLVTGLYAREAMTETKGIQGKKIEAAAEL